MRIDSKILSLPTSILLLLASYSETALARDIDQTAARWPLNLIPNMRYGQDAPKRQSGATVINGNVPRRPVGVMKMSDDEGEKFYMEYWQFRGAEEQLPMAASLPLRARDEEEEARLMLNVSTPISYRPPFALHTNDNANEQDLKARGDILARDDAGFLCPTGTSNCSAIGYPNSCCGLDETCFQIEDTGLGHVGCCPTGSSCGGTITSCDYPNTACPEDGDIVGGGCCIPNFVCAGVGCVMNQTLVAVVTITLTYTATEASSSIHTTVVTSVVTQSTQTSVITSSIATTTSIYTGLQTTLACSTASHACPVNFGGGCCGNSYACAPSSSCLPLSSQTSSSIDTQVVVTTATGVVPVRPTGAPSTSPTTSTEIATICPTGFYACEAYYAGGCCRTGRDCHTTSCPPTSYTTIVSSGVTVVVPVGPAATLTTPTGNCATGWFSCAASDGGNCCPSDYQCGTASCSLVEATSTLLSEKHSPNQGQRSVEMSRSVIAFAGALTVILVLM